MFKDKDKKNDRYESKFNTTHTNKKHTFRQVNGETQQTQTNYITQVHKKQES